MTSAFAVGIFIAFTGLGRKILGLISAACCAESLLQPGTVQCVYVAFSPHESFTNCVMFLTYHLSEGIRRVHSWCVWWCTAMQRAQQ